MANAIATQWIGGKYPGVLPTEVNDAVDFYEVANPSFNDMTLEEQVKVHVNDWVAEDRAGRQFFGRSRSEAIRNARCYHGDAWNSVASLSNSYTY
jgi:hypothetical protein